MLERIYICTFYWPLEKVMLYACGALFVTTTLLWMVLAITHSTNRMPPITEKFNHHDFTWVCMVSSITSWVAMLICRGLIP